MVPRGERQATDCCWAFIFLGFMLGMIGLSVYGYSSANANLLLAPVDGAGNICGAAGTNTADHPKLFFDLKNGNLNVT